jgi:hypothetical protein
LEALPEKRRKNKLLNLKNKLFFAITILFLLLVSSMFMFTSTVQGAQLTAKEKSINLLESVTGLDINKCSMQVVADDVDYPSDYAGLARETVVINLNVSGGTS